MFSAKICVWGATAPANGKRSKPTASTSYDQREGGLRSGSLHVCGCGYIVMNACLLPRRFLFSAKKFFGKYTQGENLFSARDPRRALREASPCRAATATPAPPSSSLDDGTDSACAAWLSRAAKEQIESVSRSRGSDIEKHLQIRALDIDISPHVRRYNDTIIIYLTQTTLH